MKAKRHLALFLSLILVILILPTTALAAEDPLALPGNTDAFSVTVDDSSVSITAWVGIPYVAKPVMSGQFGPPTDHQQKMNIYVPANATADSAMILYVNNSGWITNGYAQAARLTEGQALSSEEDAMGAALKAGYVVVSYGCRSRGFDDENGDVIHSPATITDTKAAIRYLRYNDAALPGSAERIVMTGTSGGGALSTVISASGNSADYYPSLYAIGAAGMTSATTSTIRDNVFATIAYCPITDLPNADYAYEWTFGKTREQLRKNNAYSAEENPDHAGWPSDAEYGYGDRTMAASAALEKKFVTYFNNLELKDGGTVLRADNGSFKAAIQELLEKGVEKAIAEQKRGGYTSADDLGSYDWLRISGSKAHIDYDKFLYWVAEKTTLKGAPAFDNQGTTNEHWQYKENNLFGRADQGYSHITEWSWNNDTGKVADVGASAMSWQDFLATPEGRLVQRQGKMTNPIPYLTSDTEGDSAPYWYVRHGMADRDTSFAVEATLYFAMKNDPTIQGVDFNFAWLKPHAGNYDVPEAYAWLAKVLKAA